MVEFYLKDGFVSNCKILSFPNLRFLLKDKLCIDEEVFKNTSFLDSYPWLLSIFKNCSIDSLIFDSSSIVITKKNQTDWNKCLAMFVYFISASFSESNRVDLLDLEVLLGSSKKQSNLKSVLMHSLIFDDIKKNLNTVLADHGGNIEIVNIDINMKVVLFSLQGSCSQCSEKSAYLKKYLSDLVKKIAFDYTVNFT